MSRPNLPFKFTDLIDQSHLQRLLTDLSEAFNIPVAVLDLEGTFIAQAGGQRACTEFHRKNAESCTGCLASDLFLTQNTQELAEKQSQDLDLQYPAYKCQNGLWDAAIPIDIGGYHLANYYFGQFFYEDETIDWASFEAQAERFGYDKKEYLASISLIPRYSKEKVSAILRFNKSLIETITLSGTQLIYQRTLLKQLSETKEKLISYDQKLSTAISSAKALTEKREDLKTIVHDLKTPLIGISGLSQLLNGEADLQEGARYLSMIAQASSNMLGQIDEILQLADAEDISQLFAMETIGIDQIFEYITDKKPADSIIRGIELTSAFEESNCRLNRRSTEIIISNLISNAFKYSASGGKIRVLGRIKDHSYKIQVMDQGMGIPSEKQPLLFKKFAQVGNKPQSLESSTGVGLYVSKRFADKMDCQLTFEPNLPKGSIFTLTIPLAS
ncbi:MAG: PocR ligand-binding domain-containing protein [bacterium]|nr:PocR ligand-binding domain-containing protein [bacterium]